MESSRISYEFQLIRSLRAPMTIFYFLSLERIVPRPAISISVPFRVGLVGIGVRLGLG